MEQSTTITELAKALSKMQGELKSVPKDSSNSFYKMRYASLDAIWEVCRKPLTDNGLSIIQTPLEVEGKTYLETMILHSSGEWILAKLAINALKQEPQSIGSAITYARRYTLSAMLGISAEDDDDAETASGRGQKPNKVSTEPPKSPETKKATTQVSQTPPDATVTHKETEKKHIPEPLLSQLIKLAKDNTDYRQASLIKKLDKLSATTTPSNSSGEAYFKLTPAGIVDFTKMVEEALKKGGL